MVTSRLSSRLAAPGLDIAAVPEVVCQTVVSSLRLGAAEVWLLVDGEERRLAGVGDSSAAGERFAMRHRGETAGWLVVAPRPGEAVVTEQDADILAGIADLVAPSIAALQLHQELQRSRELLVAAREAERQRLRRELHDGVGATWPVCASRSSPRRHLVADPTASALLAAAGGSVGHAVAEVRTISNGLRPPGIDDLGLARALELLAERHRTPGLAVEVAVDEVRRAQRGHRGRGLPDRGRGPRERLAARPGDPARPEPSRRDADSLALAVVDDGVGPDGGRDARPGRASASASMRQRAEEIGGSLTVRASNPDREPSCAPSPLDPGRTAMTRVLLVDDHPLFLDGVRAALSGAEGLEVVGEAHDVASGLAMVTELRPDVVLMDLNLPDGSGIDATRAVLRLEPRDPRARDDDGRRGRRRASRPCARAPAATWSRAPAGPS